MAKWGNNFHWGDGTKWGTGDAVPQPPAPTAAVRWIIQVDWTGNGYSGTNEADYCIGMSTKRGREYYIAAGATDFEPMATGSASLKMDNTGGRYDPYNTSSPIYPNVKPGRKIRVKVKENSSGTVHYVFTGFVEDVKPISGGDSLVTIPLKDPMQWLNDQTVDMATILHSTISGAIKAVLQKVGYPFATDIKTWAQPIPIFDAAKYNAMEVINQLASAGLGNFFVKADGTACFYPLNYNSQPSHSLDQEDLLKEIPVATPWENIRNAIKVNARRRGQYPIAVIWSGTASVAANSTYKLGITFDASIGIPTYLYTLRDYKANTKSDGTGTDITGRCRVLIGKITSTSAELSIMNFTGATMYLTMIQVWGCKLVEIAVAFSDNDSGSINSYGTRRFELNNVWLQDQGYARAFATILKDFLKNPQKNPTIQIEKHDDFQYDMDLLDSIPLTVAKLGINHSFRVGGIEQQWIKPDEHGNCNGQAVLTTLYLQSVVYSNATITADPYYPPAVPPVTPPYDPTTPPVDPTPEPTPDPDSDVCYTDMDAATNGPYKIGASFDLYAVAATSKVMPYECMIRSASAANKTTLVINGSFWTTADNGITWTPLPDTDDLIVDALDGVGDVIDTATLQTLPENGIGTLSAVFAPVSASLAASFRIRITGGSAIWYIYGSAINHGPIPVTVEEGLPLLDNADEDFTSPDGHILDTAALYAVQGKPGTGPWYYSAVDAVLHINPQYGIEEGQYYPPDQPTLTPSADGCVTASVIGDSSNEGRWYKGIACSGYAYFDLPTSAPAGATIHLYIHENFAVVWSMYIDGVYYSAYGYAEYIEIVIDHPFSQISFFGNSVSGGDSAHQNHVYVTWDEFWAFGDGLYKDIVTVAPQERIYFAAATGGDKDRVRVEDTPGQFANNGSAIDFELFHAGESGDIHLSIDSVLLYNVCPPPSTS
jgi:hypothetical protein